MRGWISLVIQCTLLAFEGADAASLHWNSKRALSIQDCPTRMSALIAVSMPTVRSILDRAESRLADLYVWIAQVDVPNIEDQDALLASTFRTYTTLIERYPDVSGHPFGEGRQTTATRVWKMHNLTMTMKETLNKRPDLEIWCHDRWWKPYRLDGSPPRPAKQGQYLDHRVTVAPEEDKKRVWMTAPPLWANPLTNHIGYTIDGDMAGPYKSVTVLNLVFAQRYYATAQAGESIAELKQRTLGPKQIRLSKLTSSLQIPSVLIHEFSHSHFIAGKEQRLLDTTEFAGYHWVNTDPFEFLTMLTSAPDIAPDNAESFTVFVVALYLDEWDWSLGYNRPLEEAKGLRAGSESKSGCSECVKTVESNEEYSLGESSD